MYKYRQAIAFCGFLIGWALYFLTGTPEAFLVGMVGAVFALFMSPPSP